MKRYCFALDLVDDAELITAYEHWHKSENVWPEIKASIAEAGIEQMEIYRIGNRLFMIMDVNDSFDFARKAAMDAANPKVQAWEQLMWKFQQALPWAAGGEKWMMMQQIFSLK
ncbi:MAG TPA: L-fucose mutarotase [Chitinophagaceae bacterium]|nr:L-fucose mutarotase [Chitinophagaceae bacterium]